MSPSARGPGPGVSKGRAHGHRHSLAGLVRGRTPCRVSGAGVPQYRIKRDVTRRSIFQVVLQLRFERPQCLLDGCPCRPKFMEVHNRERMPDMVRRCTELPRPVHESHDDCRVSEPSGKHQLEVFGLRHHSDVVRVVGMTEERSAPAVPTREKISTFRPAPRKPFLRPPFTVDFTHQFIDGLLQIRLVLMDERLGCHDMPRRSVAGDPRRLSLSMLSRGRVAETRPSRQRQPNSVKEAAIVRKLPDSVDALGQHAYGGHDARVDRAAPSESM